MEHKHESDDDGAMKPKARVAFRIRTQPSNEERLT